MKGELESGRLKEASILEGGPVLRCYLAYRRRNAPPEVANFIGFVRGFSKWGSGV